LQAGDQNYLVPVEEVDDFAMLDYKALRVATLLQGMESAGGHLNLILLDACRSTPPAMRSGSRNLSRGLSKITAPAGTVISFACSPGETASDGNGANGVFTANLLRHLEKPGEDIDYILGYGACWWQNRSQPQTDAMQSRGGREEGHQRRAGAVPRHLPGGRAPHLPGGRRSCACIQAADAFGSCGRPGGVPGALRHPRGGG